MPARLQAVSGWKPVYLRVLILGLLSCPLLGQTSFLALSSATALPGGAVALDLTLSTASGAPPAAAVQWTLTYNAASISSITVGAASLASAAGKSLTCASSAGSYTCILSGQNDIVLQSGTIATLNVTLAPAATRGVIAIGLANVLGASAIGGAVAFAESGGSITVTPPPIGVSSISCNPSNLGPGGAATCTGILNGPAPAGGSLVTLSSNNTVLSVPPSVLVAASSTSATFSATAGSFTTDQTATVTATLNGTSPMTVLSLVVGGGASGYLMETFAGGNPPPTPITAISASLGSGRGVVADSAGNFYFNSSLDCTFKIDTAGNLTRLAGTCRPGYSGDGSAAIAAQLNAPDGIAVDASGDLFISDRNNHRVREVSASGLITTVAGTGTPGYSGDNGPGTAAQLNAPAGLALDGSGNLYIADSKNNVIRKLSPGGIITTVAGNGMAGYSGDGAAAASAQLTLPLGVALDSAGNLYIADSGNNRIREVLGGLITTVAGNGVDANTGDGGAATQAAIAYPVGVAAVAPGVFYLTSSSVVRRVSGGIIQTVAGTSEAGYSGDGGPGTNAQLNSPYGLGLDLSGDLYIADAGNYRIRQLTLGGTITTVAGNGAQDYSGDDGPAVSAQISLPANTAADSAGNLYLADFGNNRIRKVSATGIISTIAGTGGVGNSGDNSAAINAQVGSPAGVAVDSSGNVYVTVNYGVREVTPAGIITTVAGTGTPGYSGDGGPATSAQLNGPQGLTVDSGGNLYIADSGNNVVRKVSAAGGIMTIAGKGSAGYSGDGGLATNAQLNAPDGVALDSLGNLYIADQANQVIRKMAGGIITTVAGTGTAGYSGDGGAALAAQLNEPTGVAADSAGNLYIADQGNSRVRLVANGLITTIAGTGTPGYSGDGGRANLAALDSPAGITVDSIGNLYVADSGGNAIRLLTLPLLVTSLGCVPGTLMPGATTNCTATLNLPAPAGGATLMLSSNNAALTVAPSLLVPALSTSASFTATAGSFTTNQTATVAATWNSSSQSANLSLVASGLLALPFFATATPLASPAGWYDEILPNGNLFGYFTLLSNDIIYHADLGYEYVTPALDSANGVYLYDFQSGHWWYTSATYPFPYLYDFNLNTVLYYYPAPGNPGHYTSNPRDFYDFGTGEVITM